MHSSKHGAHFLEAQHLDTQHKSDKLFKTYMRICLLH
jgi:hypothetical protein